MKCRFTVLAVIVVACICFVAAAFSQSRISRPSEGPRPVPFRSADGRITGWRVSIPGNRPLATPAIAEGKVFVGGGFGSHEFYAFDAQSGEPIWVYHTADDGPTAAVVEDGRIIFNTESCELEVITTGGRPLWKKWLGDPLMSMPAAAGGMVYMAYPNSRGDRVYYVAAFDLRSGDEIWRHRLADEIITAPVIDRERVYLATVDGSVQAFERQHGALIWQENRNATSAPAVWNEHAYFSRREAVRTTGNSGQAPQQTEVVAARPVAPSAAIIDLPTTRREADYLDYKKRAQLAGELKSQALDASVGFAGANKGSAQMFAASANIGQASVHGIWAYQGSKSFIDHARLYGSMGDRTQSVDPDSGRVIWSRVLNGKRGSIMNGVLTPPTIVNGKIFVANSDGDLYALSARTGDELWSVHLGEAIAFQPVVARGRVYVATTEGTLYCLNTNDPADDGWLMWGGTPAHNGLNAR
jgi:Ca-activated chloride channel homolog